ncbi:MAG TPA: hypothetical protein VE571_08175 [Solirubrobacteraceae bacterium]|nr:hypothetical protein [Solirubrobacteraceae bacterium]
MADAFEALLESLLWEGYALYPYTPGATKNATPTPFGILYPPVYAATLPSTFDHSELRCVVQAPADAVLRAEIRFLAASGERHQAAAHRVELPGAMAGALAGRAAHKEVSVGGLTVGMGLETRPLPGEDAYEVVLRVQNLTLVSSGLDRAGALRRSLISAHPVLRVTGGRFVSALERPCGSVNTFPVLATDADDVVLGAAIVLPDHPRLAPESLGGHFDSTEIEEALLLHLRTLSDDERAQIERQDPAVREMVQRAAAATPEDIVALHGRVELRDPVTTAPPTEPPGLADPRAGDSVLNVAGRTFRRGGKVVIRPGPGADIQARMLDGRTATVERIFTDYDGKAHLGLTIDDDPGQELMRETGRFLYFFAPELEVVES